MPRACRADGPSRGAPWSRRLSRQWPWPARASRRSIARWRAGLIATSFLPGGSDRACSENVVGVVPRRQIQKSERTEIKHLEWAARIRAETLLDPIGDLAHGAHRLGRAPDRRSDHDEIRACADRIGGANQVRLSIVEIAQAHARCDDDEAPPANVAHPRNLMRRR